jgi:MerR family transcriptional regulator, light-induced transcriptional regulator
VAAIATARKTDSPPPESFFAHLRSQAPGLQAHILPKRTLSALTWAVEDECCARADRPLLFGAFQREITYRRSETRWREVARTAARATVFADFGEVRDTPGAPLEIPLPAGSAALREWVLICDSPDYPACVVAWELPSAVRLRDGERRFETVWSLDGRITRQAALGSIAFVERLRPDLAQDLVDALPDTTTTDSADLRRATTLFSRMLAYT